MKLIKERYILFLIFIIAVCVRIIAVINLPVQYKIPVNDAEEYDALALNILSGKGYINTETGSPTAFRAPLYPVFLAVIYFLFGHSYSAVRIIQAVIGALLCIVLYFIAKKIFDKKTAVLSASLLVLYQPYIFYLYFGGPGFLLTEYVSAFLLGLMVLFMIMGFIGTYSFKYTCLSGTLLGLVNLTRPVLIIFPVFLFFLLLHIHRYIFLKTLKAMLPFLICFILVILPWTIRNYIVFKEFIPIGTHGGYAFWAGNNPLARGGWGRGIEPVLNASKAPIKDLPENQAQKVYFKAGIDYIKENIKNPLKMFRLFAKKILVFWNVFTEFDGYNLSYAIILIFALVGILSNVKFNIGTGVGISLLFLIFAYFMFNTLVFFGDPRFRYPIEPYLIIFASQGIFSILSRFSNRMLSYGIIVFIIAANILSYIFAGNILRFVRITFNL